MSHESCHDSRIIESNENLFECIESSVNNQSVLRWVIPSHTVITPMIIRTQRIRDKCKVRTRTVLLSLHEKLIETFQKTT